VTATPAAPRPVHVPDADALLPRTAQAVDATDGRDVVVARLADSTLVAYDRRCPHLGCPVVYAAARDRFECEVSDGRSSFLRISSMRSSDGGHGPIACLNADVATSGPDIRRPRSLTARCLRESGWLMTTAVSRLTAHPLHAAVALARFGVPDGYVAPHDSPAAYARAVEAARSHCRDLGTADTRRQTSRG